MMKKEVSDILKSSQKTIALLLALLTAGGMLLSCGSAEAAPENADTAGVSTEPAAAETEPADPFEGLAREDYGGREFHFLVRILNQEDYWTEAENGEVFNDTVYARNRLVEEAYNTKIKAIPIAGEWEDRSTYLKTLSGSVFAGDGAYDLVDGYAAIIGDGYADGLYRNLNEIPNLRLDSPWWSSIIRNELTVNGRLFAMTGDIAVSIWKQMQVMFFNKEILAQYDLDSPYALVKDGKWTFDAYLSMLRGIGNDVNGDGKMDGQDRYGAVYYDALTFDNLHNAFGVTYTTHNADGTLTLDLCNEQTINIQKLATDLAYNNPDVYFDTRVVGESREAVRGMFISGQGLFYCSVLNDASVMRDMNADFGILPYPKENEAQERYYTTSRDGRSMLAVPTDAPDPAFAGMITEAMCAAGSNTLIPVYYDTVLKGKTTRDEESAEMLDIIRAGLILDFSAEYAVQTERSGFVIRDCIEQKKELTSFYASKEKTIMKAFDKFMTAYYGE